MTGTPERAISPAARLLAGAGAATVGIYFGLLLPVSLATHGLPISAAVLALVTLPLVVFLGAIAVAPEAMQRVLQRHTALDLADSGHLASAIVMAGALYFVIGFGSLANGAMAIETVAEEGRAVLQEVDGNALFANLIPTILVLTLPPFLYVAFVTPRPPPPTDPWISQDTLATSSSPRAALHRLGLRLEGAGTATALGIAATFAFLLALIVVGLVMQQFSLTQADNDRALAIARALTPLGAIGLSLGAAISEEVFFRGFLQPRIGLWGQTLLFGLAHLSYVSVSEVVVVTLLGLAFGLLYKKTNHLMAPIAAHFSFNAVMLLTAISTS